MYSLRRLLKQEPSILSGLLAQVLATIGTLGLSPFSDRANTAIVGLVALFLGAIYVRPLTASRDALQEVADAQLQAIDLGKQLAPRRPLRAPPAGPPPAANP